MRVLVVGGGVIGLATAYHIKRLRSDVDVMVVDMMDGPGMGDTSRSNAAFRAAFTSPLNRVLAKSSIEFYRYVQNVLGFDLGLMNVGYLFLVDEDDAGRFRVAIDEVRRQGIGIEEVDLAKLRGLVNTEVHKDEEAREMGLKDVVEAYLVKDAGILDAEKLVRFYEMEFLRLGGRVAYGVRVTGLLERPRKPLGIPGEPFPWQDYEVRGVVTNNGVIEADKIVIATGAWTGDLMSSLGYGLPLRPRKRQIFVVRVDDEGLRMLMNNDMTGEGASPVIITPRGIVVRPNPRENTFWIAYADRRSFGFVGYDVEERLWRYGIYPVLTKYVPAFTNKTPSNAWAGYYDENVVDGLPIIDELAPNLYVAAGTSGSGVMKGDAIGRITASLVLELKEAELGDGRRIPTNSLAKSRCTLPEKLVL